jgi:transcriptional regulator with GAF, ATPase, and Fis domain
METSWRFKSSHPHQHFVRKASSLLEARFNFGTKGILKRLKSCHRNVEHGVFLSETSFRVLQRREMKAEQAAAIETGRNHQLHRSSERGAALHLGIAAKPERNPVHGLVDMASALLREAEMLAHDKEFADQSERLTLNVSAGIDLYAELKQFETFLIRLALDETGGHQARAARLLHIKPTTLNSKIKLYGIEY